MTPAETYAQSRIEAETLIRQHAPARLQDAVIERLLPAIALTATLTDDADIAIGASKFGGAPDVPKGFAWPMWDKRPLSFMAQINLAEIAPFDIENQLPSSGLLLFFYDWSYDGGWPDGQLKDEGGWRVFHFEGDLSRSKVPNDARLEGVLSTATLTARAFWSVPQTPFFLEDEEIYQWPSEERKQWRRLMEAFPAQSPHLMLAHPFDVQNDPRGDAVNNLKRGEISDWQLLLQMDTDDTVNFMWGDTGAMYYLMHRDDLSKRAFDKCWLIAQCC